MKNLTSWLNYFETVHPKEIDLTLERVVKVTEKLKLLPFAKLNFLTPFIITVTGTNGKGSTVRLLENILLNAGYKVAAYTSPHLNSFNERIRINGSDASDEAICQAFEIIESNRGQIPLTLFEFMTLAALLLFKQVELHFIILEVGLGGRLDATNILDADLALITNVSLEHCYYLGDTREKIAYEKAGIIKQNKLVCFGEKDIPEAILQKSKELNAELFYLGQDYVYRIEDDRFIWKSDGIIHYLPVPLIHPSNAALAVMAIETIRPVFKISNEALKKALAETILPGRLQLIKEPYPTLFDVAHNPHSVAHLAEYLQKNYADKKIFAVFSVLADKDLSSILKYMQPLIKHWYLAPLQFRRAAPLSDMQQIFNKLKISNVTTAATIPESYAQCLKAAQTSSDNLIVVFGSFHTVGEVLQTISK